MINKLQWKIWYDDGNTFDSDQGKPEDAPGRGVVVIATPDEMVGQHLMQGWDWYYYVEDEKQWWGSDKDGMLDHLIRRHPIRAVSMGANVSNIRFRHILTAAADDPQFQRKSGNHRSEIKTTFYAKWWKEYSQ